MTDAVQFEEQLYFLKIVSRGNGDEWSVNFARSILRQAKRPSWKPTARQQPIIAKLVREVRSGVAADTGPDDFNPIEKMEGNDAA